MRYAASTFYSLYIRSQTSAPKGVFGTSTRAKSHRRYEVDHDGKCLVDTEALHYTPGPGAYADVSLTGGFVTTSTKKSAPCSSFGGRLSQMPRIEAPLSKSELKAQALNRSLSGSQSTPTVPGQHSIELTDEPKKDMVSQPQENRCERKILMIFLYYFRPATALLWAESGKASIAVVKRAQALRTTPT